jgi:hypothetical protein
MGLGFYGSHHWPQKPRQARSRPMGTEQSEAGSFAADQIGEKQHNPVFSVS